MKRARGFSYVEVLVAAALLAICALPAADAVKNGLDAAGAGETKARELRCMKNTMETVLAEPFDNLWSAVQGPLAPSSYSRPAGSGCGIRNVFISKYQHPYGAASGTVLAHPDPAEDTLLLVTVAGPDGGYAFSTLVDR